MEIIASNKDFIITQPTELSELVKAIPANAVITGIQWLENNHWATTFAPASKVQPAETNVLKSFEVAKRKSAEYNPSFEQFKFYASIVTLAVITFAIFY